MVAKRALNFGTPLYTKRQRRAPSVVVFSGVKPEMKNFIRDVSHSAVTSSSYFLNNIAQGTSVDGRIGAKIKIYRIEYVLAQISGDPIRVDLLINNTAGGTPSHAYDEDISRNLHTVLDTRFLHSGASLNSRGAMVSKKLPYPIVAKYTGATATCNYNQIVAHLTTPVATTVTGYFRIYYTDI